MQKPSPQSFPPEPYDLIYSFGVIHHTPQPVNVLAELKHYVKPGTTLKIMVYHKFSWKVFWILLKYGKGQFWKIADFVAQNSEAQTGCPITYIYSRREFTHLLQQHGFQGIQSSIEHIFPYRIPDYVQYRYVMEWYFRYLPPSVFQWLEHHFGWHLCVTAQWKPGEE